METEKKKSQRSGLAQETRGAVYVEFLIAFMPMFVLMLGLIHLGLLYTASLVIQHSAATAARAAIVVGPDRPSRYGKAALNQLNDGCGHNQGNVLRQALGMVSSGVGGGGTASSNGCSGGGGGINGLLGGLFQWGTTIETYNCRNGRMDAIADAAAIPMLAAAPKNFTALYGQAPHSVAGGVSSSEAGLAAAYLYNLGALAVTFPTGPGADSYTNTLGGNATVRVTYLYYCPIPIVRQFACYHPLTMGNVGNSIEAAGFIVRELESSARDGAAAIAQFPPNTFAAQLALGRFNYASNYVSQQTGWASARRPRLAELRTNDMLFLPLIAAFTGGARFAVLSAEATMPVQNAWYEYYNDASGCSGGGG